MLLLYNFILFISNLNSKKKALQNFGRLTCIFFLNLYNYSFPECEITPAIIIEEIMN